jgi:hypothetical protein
MPTKRRARRKQEARSAYYKEHAAGQAEDSSAPIKPLEELPNVTLPEDVQATPSPSVGERLRSVVAHRRFPAVALVALFGLSWLAWAWIGAKHSFPNLFPDEMFYAKLSQSFAAGHGLTWRGNSFGLPPLWPLVLSVFWHFGTRPEAWHAIKIFDAALISTVVFPTWFMARRVVGSRTALIAAAFAVVGTWMAITAWIVTENLVYPVATASLAAMLVALQTTRMRWIFIALGFAAVACLARTQMLALPVVLSVALVLDVVRQPSGARRERLDAWPRALWIVLIGGVVLLLGAFIVMPHLTNYDVVASPASVGKVISTTAKHATSAIVVAGVIPVIALFGMAVDKRNWRDERVGPLLALTFAAIVVLFPLLGRFEAWATFGAPVERYSMYLMPLLGTALVVAPRRLRVRTAVIGAALTLAALFVVPHTFNIIEQPALFGTQRRIALLGSFFFHHLKISLFLLSLPLAAAGVFALTRSRHRTLALGLAFGLTAVVMIIQSSGYQNRLISDERLARPQLSPAHFDWVDRAGKGPVGLLAIGKGEPLHQNVDLYTDFFNKRIDNLYTTVPSDAPSCKIGLVKGGTFKQQGGSCAPWPNDLVLLDSPVHVTLVGEKIIAATPNNGWLIRKPPGVPKIFGLVTPPCSAAGCTGALRIGAYLKHPGQVHVVFAANPNAHQIQVGQQTETLPANQPATINFNLPAGDDAITLPVNWTTVDGPDLVAVTVDSGGSTTRLF